MPTQGLQGLLETLFSPLEGLDIAYLYDRFHTAIDFVLYAFLLVFIARLGLAKMFPGENGRRLGTVMGIALAISLSAAEYTLGFTLRSFGPIAAGLIVLMVALLLYNMMRHAGAGHMASGSTALIVTYFAIRAVLPDFFSWTQTNQWADYIHILLILAIAMALWRFGYALFAGKELAAPMQQALDKIAQPFTSKELTSQARTLRKPMKHLTISGQRETKNAIQLLKQAAQMLSKYGTERQVVNSVSRGLNNLRQKEHVVFSELSRIQQLDKLLLAFDLSKYKKLKDRYHDLAPTQQLQYKKSFVEERKKIGVEQQIAKLAKEAQTYAKASDKALQQAGRYLDDGVPEKAIENITKAIEQESKAEDILHDVRTMEKTLLYLVEKQIKEARKQGQ